MAIVNTSGTMSAATNSTACQVALTGKAQYIYLSVWDRAYGWFSKTTNSTGITTAGGLSYSTYQIYAFEFMPGEAKYWYHVATAGSAYFITESF
jgi:hypothetical protein